LGTSATRGQRKKQALRFLSAFTPSEFHELRMYVETGKRPGGGPVTSLWLLDKLKKAVEEILFLHTSLEAHDEAIHDLSEKWNKVLSGENVKIGVDKKLKK